MSNSRMPLNTLAREVVLNVREGIRVCKSDKCDNRPTGASITKPVVPSQMILLILH